MRNSKWLEWRGGLRGEAAFRYGGLDFGGTATPVSQGDRVFAQSPPTSAALTSYSLTPASTTIIEGNTSITFTISRSGDKPAETIYASTLFDTAKSPGDYDGLVNFVVSFSSGQTSRTFTVNINEDSVIESTEHFRVMIGHNTTDGSAQAIDISDVYIEDDDAPPSATYSLTPASTTRTEGNSSITFTITRSGSFPAETIYASTLFDTASSPTDYDGLVNFAVSFSSGQTSRTFTVDLNDDTLVESTEHFRVMIAHNQNDGSAQALDISDIFIEDNDTPVPAQYSLTPASTTITEGNTALTFTITRSGAFPAETLYASTLFDTAGSPTDYDGLVNFAISFTSGQTSRTFTVDINDDSLVEATEHFRVMIAHNQNDQSAQAIDISDIYIEDDDAATADQVREGLDTTSSISVNGNITGRIDAEPISGDGVTSDQQGGFVDKDWYRVTLERGHVYAFGGSSTSVSTGSIAISLYNASGSIVRSVTEGGSPSFTFDTSTQSSATQAYYVAISAGGPEPTWRTATGNYALGVTDGGAPPPPLADDYRDEATDTSAPFGSVTIGSSATGLIGPADANDTYGDKDVFKVHLEQGQAYQIRLTSTSINSQALPLGIFTIRNPANFDQVLETSGIGSDVVENFVADSTGDYYIRVGTGGAATDQGGYRLSVSSIALSGVADDFPDYPGDTSATGSAPTLSMGPSRTGVIETVGDTDIFQIALQAGHSYHFSLDSNLAGSAGSLSNLYMTLRNANDFSMRLREGGGIGQAIVPFTAEISGTYYVRVGSGSSTGTGGYRLDVYDEGITSAPTLPPPPQPTLSIVDDALKQFDYLVSQLVKNTALMLVDDSPWNALAAIMVKMNDFQAAELAGKIGKHASWFGFFLDIGIEVSQAPAGGKARAAFVALMDDLAGIAVTWAGSTAAGGTAAFVGSAVPVVGTISFGIFGMIAGGLVAHTVYERGGASHFIRESAGVIFDNHFGIPVNLSSDHASIAATNTAAATDFVLDEGSLVKFDEAWYLSTYPNAANAVASGTSGSAYAHFLTVGIDLGYRPNAAQELTRADLAIEILNNDPAALANSALLTQSLSNYAGDGVSTGEMAVASAVNGARGGTGTLIVDANLSAIASRKAIDLIANFATSAADSAQSHTDAAWAEIWSNGNQLTQQFRGALEGLIGADMPAGSLAMFVVSSSSGSWADVLARLQGQSAFSAAMAKAAFDTLGVAEFGGVWVVIVADRMTGYSVVAPGVDTLTTASIYGSDQSESLYSGMRAGRLFGLDGNDTLVSGVGRDYLDGGTGDDTYVINEAQDLVIELPGGGRDTIFSNVSYALAAGAEIEVLTTLSPNATTAIDFVGNAFANTIFGNAGANILDGLAGNDVLIGGAGVDIARFHSVRAANVIVAFNGTTAVFNPAGHETDWMQQVETLQFDDISLPTATLVQFRGLDYIATHDDLIRALGANAQAGFEHFVNYGFFEGRAQDGFDGFQYLATYNDLILGIGPNETAAAVHFISSGFAEHRVRDGFDGLQYVAANDDLIRIIGADETGAARHFVTYGFGEHRARDGFDGLQYVAAYDDLIRAFGTNEHNAAQHFIVSGFNEHRARDGFDGLQYIASYGDLIRALGTNEHAGAQHFIEHGFSEGRARDTFDAAQYLANYTDLRAAFGNDQTAATIHYISYGFSEGRTDDPLFGA